MAGFSTTSNEHLIRSNVWSSQLKDVLEDELIAQRWVRFMTDFPDGDTWNMPSIGAMTARNYTEGEAVQYSAMDTGNFTFTITEYMESATYITEKMKQDMFYMNELVSSFVPKQHRALMKNMEVKVLDLAPTSQTATSLNAINGGDHRFVASGTNNTMAPKDFQRARYALQKADVPMENLIAIVDPSVEFELSTMTNLVNLSNNKQWEGIVRDGVSNGLQFRFNIFGWDVYISQNLASIGVETIDSVTTDSAIANVFFSASPDVLPFIGAIRQPPRVDSEFNKDLQREEFVTTMRYGLKVFRPENLVVVLSDDDNVS